MRSTALRQNWTPADDEPIDYRLTWPGLVAASPTTGELVAFAYSELERRPRQAVSA